MVMFPEAGTARSTSPANPIGGATTGTGGEATGIAGMTSAVGVSDGGSFNGSPSLFGWNRSAGKAMPMP